MKKSVSCWLNKVMLSCFAFLFFVLSASSQSITNYSFSAGTSTFSALSTPTNPSLTSGSQDDGYFNSIPIGFDFWYMGARYTTVSASTNGWLTLGSNITDAMYSNDISTGGNPRPVIAPLWDDLAIQLISNVSHKTTGTAGSRVFTLQYINARWDYTASGNSISFQVKIYETTGKIEFNYRTSLETGVLNSPSACIGITASGTGSGNFLSLNNAGASPTASSSSATNSIGSKPANNQLYSFTPQIPTAPSNLSFTSVSSSAMTLNWSDMSANERGFAIYRSTDGVNYSFVSQTAAGATSSVQSGLTTSITYYWRVYAVTEGGLSTALSGSWATICTSLSISQIPTTSIILNYKFNGNASDEEGNNPGTLQNNPTPVADRFGNSGSAYSFNGANQHVTTTNSYVNPNNLTISAWIKTGTNSGGKIIGFGNSQTGSSSTYGRHIYMNNAGQIYMGVYYLFSTRTINSSESFNDNEWHLITGTFSSTSGMVLYVDGVQVASNASYTNSESTTGYWRIGYDNLSGWPSSPSTPYFGGIIDDVLIYHTALSSSQVSTIYNSPDGVTNNGPLCASSTLNLTAPSVGGATYLWSGPNGFSSTQQNPSVTYTPAHEGVYSVTVTSGGCSATGYTRVISQPTSSTISYSGSPFCKTTATGSVTLVGTPGGTYSSTAGLVINSSTGVINPSTSTAGTYTVTYSITGGCSATTTVVINGIPTTANAGPDQTGVATCGLTLVTLAGNSPAIGTGTWSIVSGTGGAIQTPSSPTSVFTGVAGNTYTLRWTISSSPCTSSTDNVIITFNRPPTVSNAGPDQNGAATCGLTSVTLAANSPSIGTGAWSIISGSGGTVTTPGSPTSTFNGVAGSTYTLRWTISNSPCSASTDEVVVSFSVPPSVSGSSTETCVGGSTGTITVVANGGTAPYTYSINGGSYQSSAIFTGLAAGTYTTNARSNSGCVTSEQVVVSPFAASNDDQNLSEVDSWVGHMYDGIDFNTYLGHFSEPETFNELFGGSTTCFNIVSNSTSRSIYTETFSVKYRMTSSKRGLYIVDLGSDDGSRLTVDGQIVYNNWALQSFGSKPGVLINLSGNSNLVYEYYENGGGNQVVFTNLTQVFANTLSNNITQGICSGSVGTTISGDIFGTLPAGISLSGTGYQWSYSTTPGGARTNIAGQTGATFTPSAALAPFNTPGTYYIYRNAAVTGINNVSPNPYTATNESNAAIITVTALPAATISYAANPYCANAGFATVSRVGTSGGTYSAGAGLSINESTGQINLSLSTPGTYTVTYTMLATGGCSQQTATTSVTITAVPSAVFSYAGSPYSQNGGTATVTFNGTPGGTFTSTAGLSINSSTGAITLATSTPGNYVVTYTVIATGGCSQYSTTTNVGVLVGTKIFTGTGNFSDPARWTDGTVPVAGENLVIDGICTVDNNPATDNVQYGTLTLGTSTARTLNWAVSGTNRLNVQSLITGPSVSTLDMSNGGTLVIRNSIAAGLLNFTPGNGTIEVQSSMLFPAVPELNNFVVNGPGAVIRLGGDIVINGNLTISDGTLNSNSFDISIKGNWVNNASIAGFSASNSEVEFNGTTSQFIGGSFTTTFNDLLISNSNATVSLGINTIIAGNLAVNAGTLDLGSYNANRATPGGVLSVANSATLRIGGTNTFPGNYTTNTLVVASTVHYAGTNQSVANQVYGNLLLSSSTGAAVKTFPGTAMNILGNLTTSIGTGTSVTLNASASINVTGNVTLAASTTFNGGSASHTVAGNWINSGTFNGNTGTMIFSGAGKTISGAGTQNFNNLSLSGTGITLSSSIVTITGNLATISSGSFTHSADGTIIMSGTGKTITGSAITLVNLTLSGSINTTATFSISGNLVVSGSLTATSGTITMSGVSKTISGVGTAEFATLGITGSITTSRSFTIRNGLSVFGSFSATAGTATFTGTSVLNGTANLYDVSVNGTSMKMSTGSVLGIANALNVLSGSFDAEASMPNTVNFNGSGNQVVPGLTYCTLIMSNGGTKTASANFVTRHNITIGSATTFDPGTFTHAIYGDWINNGTFIPNLSTVEFLGGATAHVYGETTFNILTSNTSSLTTELILEDNVSASIVNMTNGVIMTGDDTLTITNTRTGIGYIFGHITRTHNFSTGVSYAFEGPDNTINFTAVTGVSIITVSVKKGAILDFPFGSSISREYNISVPTGTYTAAVRFHYENDELNGNIESEMGLWRYDTTQWIPVGKNTFDTVANYIEQIGLTNITNRWSFSINPSVVLWNGSVSSDWNTAANWTVYVGSGSAPPTASDVAVIGGLPFVHQPIISTPVTVKNVAFAANQSVTLSLTSGGSLVSGDLTGVWEQNARHTINVNGQTITVNGNLTLGDGVIGHEIDLNIGGGHVKVIGSLYQASDANVTFTGNGKLSIQKDFHQTGGLFTPGTGTVEYVGSENQHTAHVPYNNLSINKTDGIAVLDSVTNIAGDFNVLAGLVELTAEVNILGNVNISSGASLNNSNRLNVGGNWTNNGNYTATASRITFNGTGTQTISSSTFNFLEINKPVGSVALLSGDIAIKSDLTITSGTFDIKTFQCERTAIGGTLTLADSATFILGGNNAPANFESGSLSVSSTVIANGTGPQAIYGENFGNIILRNGGLKTLVTPISVNGSFTIENGATFNGGTETLTLNGNWINNGDFIPASGTVLCNGISKTISGTTTFNRLLITGGYTLLSNITIDKIIDIASTGAIQAASDIHVTMNGDLVNNGLLYSLGTTTFTGNVLQTLSLINAVQTVAITVNFNGTIPPVLVSTSAPQFGFLNINNTGGIYPSVGWTVLYGLTVGPGASFHGGSSTHNIAGYLVNNGTITSGGTLNFIPSATTAANLGTDFSSTGTVNFGGTGQLTISGSAAEFNNIIISNTNVSGITSSGNWNLTESLKINPGAKFNAGDRTYNIGGDFLDNGTFNSQASIFRFNGNGSQSINTPFPFNILTIDKSTDSVKFAAAVTVNGSFIMENGGVNLHNYSLLSNGISNFKAGSMNNGTVNANGVKTIFGGTTFGAIVNATSDSLYLDGSIFNNTTTLVKNGSANITGIGGNIFNGATNITSSGSGDLILGNEVGDVFNTDVSFSNTGSKTLHLAFNSTGNEFNGNVTFNNSGDSSQIHSNFNNPAFTTNYNGNIIVNSTGTAAGIYFGEGGGKAQLAAGKTISKGATGFSTGTLSIGNFTQLGNTSQALALTGTSLLQLGTGTVFNGNINFNSPQLLLNGATYNGSAILEKTGATDNNSDGGNIFNSDATISLSGPGWLALGNLSPDTFNGTTVFNNSSANGIYIAHVTAGTNFNGDVFYNNNGTGKIYNYGGATSSINYNGNIVVSNTSTGGVTFGVLAGGSGTLANTKTISVGSPGFTKGTLTLLGFKQLGGTHQELTLTGTAMLQLANQSEFNGSVNFSSPQMTMAGVTFNGSTVLTKSGAGINASTGGNTFNGVTTINSSGSGSFDLANNDPDIYNNDAVFNNTGVSRIQVGVASVGTQFNGNTIINHGGNTNGLNFVVARSTGSTVTFNGNLTLNCTNQNAGSGIIIGNDGTVLINGNVLVSSTSGRGVLFNDVSGSTTLAAGYTISAVPGSFTTGTLKIARFTQLGNVDQSLTLSGSASLQLGPSSVFNGAVNFIAPQLYLNGTRFNSSAVLRKSGAVDNTSIGGNMYYGPTTISNNGTGFLRLGNTTADQYYSDVTFVQTGSGALRPAYATSSTIAGNLSTTGTATPIIFGSTITMDAANPQAIIGSLAPTFNNLIISNTGNTVASGVDINVSGNLSVTSGTFDLGTFSANRLTPGGTLSLSDGAKLVIGGTNTIPANYSTHSVGATSTIEYSGIDQGIATLNSSQKYGNLQVSGFGAGLTTADVAVANNVIVSGSFDINSYTLMIGGSIANTGDFTASNGTIEMDGTVAQAIPASAFKNDLLKGLTIRNNAGVTIGGSLNLLDVLTVAGGSLNTADYLTLKSSDTATARIAEITSLSPNPIVGNVTVERYVPGRRKYRLITSSVTTSSAASLNPGEEHLSIWGNWQNLGNNVSANAGNFITGGTAADGFDTQTPNASLFTYDDENKKYVGFTSAAGKNTKYTPLKAGIAYYMFVYGDRRNTITTSTPNSTILNAKGAVKTGDQLYNTSSPMPLTGVIGRWTMLGNPFASPIDWATIPKTDLLNTYWGWDPNLAGTGGYVTVSTMGDITITSPMSGVTGINQYIQSGQGFFVRTTGSSPAMTIREQDKVGNNNRTAFREVGAPLPLLAVNLQYGSGATKLLADGVVAAFDNDFSNQVGNEDAPKMINTAEGLAISNSGELLSIDARKMPAKDDTLFLSVSKLVRPAYSLQIFAKELLAAPMRAYLEDTYLNTSQLLSLSDTNRIDFTVNPSIAASSSVNRFRIVFKVLTLVLPVNYTSVRAAQEGEDVRVKWDISEESNIKEYEVERSTDGLNFTKIGSTPSKGNNAFESYDWLDEDPMAGNNYYRIRAVEYDGTFILSRVVNVKIEGRNSELRVFPNPVQNGQINLHISAAQSAEYIVTLIDLQGRLVLRQEFNHPGGTSKKLIQVNQNYAAGIYHLEVKNKSTMESRVLRVEL